jgi:hypothetical protein
MEVTTLAAQTVITLDRGFKTVFLYNYLDRQLVLCAWLKLGVAS